MAYDPAWDMPQTNWLQQGSFESGEIPPAVDPDAGTQICIGPIAQEWLPVVLGALDQLRNPSTWIVADDAHMDTTLRRVDKLREIIAVGEGCTVPVMMRLSDTCVLQYSNDGGATWVDTTDWVSNFGNCVRSDIPQPVPIDPNPALRDQHACNIAGYLAQAFIELTMVKVVAYVGTSGDQLAFANSVMGALAGAFPLTAGFVNGLYRFYNLVTAQLLAEVTAARDDPGLWSEVTCVIYQAIRAVGYVDATNFAAVQTGLYAISYPHLWVPLALGNYWGDLGLTVIQELQNVGAIDVIDCGGCSGAAWCHYFDFSLNDGGWSIWPGQPGHYVAGVGFDYNSIGSGLGECVMAINIPGPFVNITEVQVDIAQGHATALASTHGVSLYSAIGGTDLVDAFGLVMPTTYPGFTWVSVPIVGSAGCVAIDLVSGFTSGPNFQIIGGVQIRGTGVNPFAGGNNCVVGP